MGYSDLTFATLYSAPSGDGYVACEPLSSFSKATFPVLVFCMSIFHKQKSKWSLLVQERCI